MVRPETFYERLGVDQTASEAEVERAYRERAKQCHPDVSDHPDAGERFHRLNRARDVLTDPTERARYDRLGHATYCRRAQPSEPGAEPSGRESAASDSHDGRDSSAPDDGREARESEARATGGSEGRTASEAEGSTRTGRSTDGETPPGAPTGPAAGAESGGPRGRLGQFALGEAAAALVVAVLGGGLLWLVGRPAVQPTVGGRPALAAVLVGWVVVATAVGHLAGRWPDVLPDDVVRAQAFPLVLLVGAWYAGRLGRSDALVGALAAYGAFTALFRTVAMVAAPGDRTLRAAVVWFVATAPAVLVGYVRYADTGGVPRRLLATAEAAVPGGLGVGVLAVAPTVTVVLGYALWRSWRALR